MPAEPPEPDNDARFARGFFWDRASGLDLEIVIEEAFRYRGDVTLGLESGESLTGYLANRDARARRPFVDLLIATGGRRRLYYEEIETLTLSGKDPAAGKSWESWVRRWNAKKEAQARGEDVGEVGLFPEELD